MPELLDPVPRVWRTALRRAVHDHALSERRASHLALLHAGVPGGAEVVVAADGADAPAADDHTLRTDVVAALLRRAGAGRGAGQGAGQGVGDGAAPTLLWLTRAGDLDPEDVDLRWLAAARAASDEAGTDLTLVVVNRRGWRDPRSGTRREWARVRRR